MERFQLVTTIPRERGSSTSKGFTTCSVPLGGRVGGEGESLDMYTVDKYVRLLML